MTTYYRRQYRSTPRHPAIRGTDFAKCAAVLVGFIALCWAIVF
jgi:hypothetical protein